jgi:hypothetical protein
MTSSSAAPTAPAAPNTQNVAVGLLVAEAMSKSNAASQKQLQSQKEIGEQFMEQNIASAIQQIMNTAPDHTSALASIKKFLGAMDAADSGWGTDVQSWIKGELNTANSYTTPQNLLDDLSRDTRELQEDQQDLQEDQSGLNSCNSKKDELVSEMNLLKAKLDHCPWYEAPVYALAIAGLGIAIGGVYVAIGLFEAAISSDNSAIDHDRQHISQDKQKINNDPVLGSTLNVLSSGNQLMRSQADQNVSGYKAAVNEIQAFEKSIDGIINELTANGHGGGA